MKKEVEADLAEIRQITVKAHDCLSLGLIDAKSVNKIIRTSQSLIEEMRASLLLPSLPETETRRLKRLTDLAELRETDQTLSALLGTAGQGGWADVDSDTIFIVPPGGLPNSSK